MGCPTVGPVQMMLNPCWWDRRVKKKEFRPQGLTRAGSLDWEPTAAELGCSFLPFSLWTAVPLILHCWEPQPEIEDGKHHGQSPARLLPDGSPPAACGKGPESPSTRVRSLHLETQLCLCTLSQAVP